MNAPHPDRLPDLRRLTVANLGGTLIEGLADEARAILDRHMRAFCAPVNDAGELVCPGCGSLLSGPSSFVGQFMGLYTFAWGLVHGTGNCRGQLFDDPDWDLEDDPPRCGWPCTAYHRVRVPGLDEPLTFNALLPMHPWAVVDQLADAENRRA